MLKMNEKSTTDDPSLSSDSPSIIVPRVAAAPSSLSRATTATGSVAERMVPMSQAYVCEGQRYSAHTIVPEQTRKTTPGSARMRIWVNCVSKIEASIA